MFLLKILVFVLALIVGVCFIIYAEPLVRFFGKTAWAEEHFQTMGGTYLVWKIVGIIVIIVGLLFLTGTFDYLFR